MSFTPLILAHIATAVGALMIGAIALFLRKGSTPHRLLGRLWVALMVSTAMMSFGIRTNGHFSWIHLLSIFALVGVAASIFAVARGNIRAHRGGMLATYISLAVAGAFTLLPGRRLGDLVWAAVGFA